MSGRAAMAALLAAGCAVLFGNCTGEVGRTADADSDEVLGAGGRDISEYWPSIDIPLSQNTRMLSFEMLRSEVLRATGRSWVVNNVDQWEPHRTSLGGADYVSTFADDVTPSQQRIVLIRKMAFQVCSDLVATEAGTTARSVFTELDPGAAFDAGAATTEAQIRTMFSRFFITSIENADLDDAKALLHTLSPTGADGGTAWRGLCAAYLGSMRFLTY
jgi:hypothetical protein